MRGKACVVVCVVVFILYTIICLVLDGAFAETYFTMCNPDSFVNVRRSAKKDSEVVGFLYFGDKVEVDGKKKNGFWHVTGLSFETDEGWVKGIYLDECEPVKDGGGYVVVSKGRVAARNGVRGSRKGWVKPGTEVVVYGISDDWAVTNRGYIMSDYLEGK